MSEDGADSAVIPAAMERINQDVTLTTRTVAQAESTRSYFLAQTLESTRTVPIVSANLPLDMTASDPQAPKVDVPASDEGDEVGEDSDESDLGAAPIAAESIVVGSFEYRGITYAVEPGGESVAAVAADYSKLPEEFIEAQTIVLPSVVAHDGTDFYSVTRIADNAFAGLTSEVASQYAVSVDDAEGVTEPADDEAIGITAITIPASITEIGDEAFTNFDTLQYIIVSEDNPSYSQYDGALYDADQTCLLLIPGGRLGAVRIAPSVTSVSPAAFSHCAVDTLVADADSAAFQLLSESDFHNADGKALAVNCFVDVDPFNVRPYIDLIHQFDDDNYVDTSLLVLDAASRSNAVSFNSKSTYWSVGATLYSSKNAFDASTTPYNEHASSESTVTINGEEFYFYTAKNLPYRKILYDSSRGYYVNSYNPPGSSLGITQPYAWLKSNYCKGIASSSDPAKMLNAGDVVTDAAVIFYAKFYTVSWDANGGQGVPSSQDDTRIITLPSQKPTRDRFEFNGWKVITTGTVSGGTKNTDGFYTSGTLTFTADITLQAQWRCINTISFNANGGSGGQSANVTATYGKAMPAISTTKPSRAGYAFAGWYDTSAATGGNMYYTAACASNKNWDKTSDTMLYARWTANDITMTWNAHNETSNTTSTQKCDANLNLPAQPTKAGYAFAGWWTAETGGTQVTSISKVPTSNTTYHARWTANDITMTWNAHDGTAVSNTTQKCDATITLPSTTRAGYTFAGWWTAETGGTQMTSTSKVPTSNTTYHARWIVNGYTIDYDGNEATGGSTASTSATYDANVTFAKCGFERTGYTFKEWNTKADGSGTAYSAEKEYAKPNLVGSGSATLYAIWTQDNYRIEFVAIDPAGESVNHYVPSGSVDPITDAVYGEALSGRNHPAAALTCTGYELLGWSTDRDAIEVDSTFLFNGRGEGLGTYAKEGPTTLYSIWKPRTVKVSFDPNVSGGERTETTQTFNRSLSNVPSPTRFGYRLSGWYRDANGTGVALDTDAPFRPTATDLAASEIVYFAKWDPVTYSVTLLPGAHGSYATMAEEDEVVEDDDVRGGYKYVHGYTVSEKEWSFAERKPKPEGGWSFAGWQRLEGGEWKDCAGYVDAESFADASSLTFRAKWSATSATIELDLNGADMADQQPGFSDVLSYSVEEKATLPASLLWAGHTFQGWELVKRGGAEVAPSGTPSKDVIVQGEAGHVPDNLVYQAQWVSDTYTVRFLRSSSVATELAPSQSAGRDDAIDFATPSFREAFDLDRSENPARIFKGYRIATGAGSYAVFYPGQSTSVAELLEAYPDLKDASGNAPEDGSVIAFYGWWEYGYSVDVPLLATIAFDPDHADDSVKTGEARMRIPHDGDTAAIEVVSLICAPTSATKTAFDDEPSFYDHAYLTLSARKGSDTSPSLSEGSPVEMNVGAALSRDGLSLHGAKVGEGETARVLSLPEIGFSFGGATDAERTLNLAFGIRFDDGVDASKLRYLNDKSFKDTGRTVELVNVYYTLAMKR